jgi:protein TonB
MDDTYGRVIVGFTVEKDGKLSDFKVEKSLGTKFDTEALRVLKKSPKWIPGRLKGKPVRVRYSVPINFTIS